MCRVLCCLLVAAAVVGCREGKSTAPSKDPNNPTATRELKVKAPSFAKEIHQDDSKKFSVEVVRVNFNGPITVEVRNLPAGVTLVPDDMVIPVGKDVLVMTLKAAADAPVVKGHAAEVAVKAKDEPDLPEAVVKLTLDVLDKGNR